MAACPLCSDRPIKRYCPAIGERICPICCGTKREIEIDCPSHCSYLQSGRNYEADKRIFDEELTGKANRFDSEFLYKYSGILDGLCREVVVERVHSQWLVDNDVIEVYKALRETYKTLSSGIYYESLPEGVVRTSLFHRLKALVDQLMEPQETGFAALKASEAIELLDFLSLQALANSGVRPKSRRYLDWLASVTSPEPLDQEPPGGLILP